MANIIVTGASGFIGSHLIRRLKKDGHTVFPIPHKTLTTATTYLKDQLEKFNPDYIYHLSSYGNMNTQTDEDLIVATNVIHTWNLLQVTKDIPYKAFVNFGSSSEYGKKDEVMTESMLPEADTFYGASKVASTYLCKAFAKQYDKPIVTVRPFSVYGPGEATFRFIPKLISELKRSPYGQMTVDMHAKHDWIYIDDFIDALLLIASNALRFKGQVVNIGTGKETRNVRIVKLLQQIADAFIQVTYINGMRPNDSPVWKDGSSKLKKLNWSPTISLEEGLRRCYEYYKNI